MPLDVSKLCWINIDRILHHLKVPEIHVIVTWDAKEERHIIYVASIIIGQGWCGFNNHRSGMLPPNLKHLHAIQHMEYGIAMYSTESEYSSNPYLHVRGFDRLKFNFHYFLCCDRYGKVEIATILANQPHSIFASISPVHRTYRTYCLVVWLLTHGPHHDKLFFKSNETLPLRNPSYIDDDWRMNSGLRLLHVGTSTCFLKWVDWVM